MVEVCSQNCLHVLEAPRTKNSISVYLKIFLKLLCFLLMHLCKDLHTIHINISRYTGIVIFDHQIITCVSISINSMLT